MVSKDLTFNLFGRDVNATASMRRVAAAAEESSRGMKRSFGELPKFAALAVAGVTIASVKMAADFQQASTRLVTDAGESASKLGMVKAGMLDISSATGTSAKEIAGGMYLIESAGFHGAAGLQVMRAAAEGAKIGMADQKTVADALTTTMTDYNFKGKDAALVMSQLTATVSTGKTNMEALAGSLHSVLPAAASAKISLQEVLGAVGTMTQEGISADQATQNLNHAIASLSSPTAVARTEMAQMGLNALDVSQHLGQRGLTGTFELLNAAIVKHMGKSGLVIQSAMNQSKIAAQSARTEMEHFPPALKTLATEFLNNTITQKQWTAGLKGLPVETANLGKQFATTAKHAHGFSDLLKSGGGVAQTYNAAMEKMTGGMTGLQVALHLTGDHMPVFKANVDTIAKATAEAGGHVRGWADTQKGFNVQLGIAVESFKNMGIGLGTFLLPGLTKVVVGFSGFAKGLRDGNPAAIGLTVIVGTLVGALTAAYLAQRAYVAGALIAQGVMGVMRVATIAWTGAQWLLNAALDANPIGLVIIAVGALIAGIVLLVTHWKDVCAFLQSAWKATVGFLLGALKLLMTRFFEFVLLPVAIMQHWGQISAFLGTLWNHVIAGIAAFIPVAVGWFQRLPGWILNAIGKATVLLFNVGVNLIQGLINGVTSMIGNVTSTIGNIAGSAVNAAKAALGIHSPSTVFHSIGTFVGQGLNNGLLGSVKQVQSSANILANTVIGMFSSKKAAISRATGEMALATIQGGTKELMAEAAKRASLAKQIAATQKTLNTELAAQKKAVNTDLKSNTMTAGDVTKWGSAGDMVNGLAGLVQKVGTFKTDLQKLAKMGLDSTTFGQIVAAGISGGGFEAAQSLVQNPLDVKEIASMQSQLQASAQSLASYAGGVQYGAQIAGTRSHLATLQGAQRVETWKSQKTAANMVNTVARETHVHVHLSGNYAGTKDDLAKTVTTAIKDAVRRGQLPKNVLTAL